MRKKIEMEKRRFNKCVVIDRAINQGNNIRYVCRCNCGREFVTSGQQLRSEQIDRCPACRKAKCRAVLRKKKAIENIRCDAIKYTLMNAGKTRIIKGSSGIHSYFSKAKARLAARVIGNAVAVPLNEAIGLCRE